ncbi:MAG: hypothetical protein HWN70_06755 [Desulfobacterales bacterium]|nr:hypothetical protein [Desulfobacterales bacterium]
MKKDKYPAVLALIGVFLVSGCSWYKSYGKVRLQSGPGHKVTIQELQQNWHDYTIYYAGSSVQLPSAIMFDPKKDTKTLMSDKWIKVEDQETLSELISWIQGTTRFPPRLQRILGPDDQFYGYFYSGWHHVVLKVVDETTLWVYDLPVPPDFYYNGDGDEKTGPDPAPTP